MDADTQLNPSTKLNVNPPSPSSSGEICIIEADSGLGDLLVELLENQFLVKSFSGLQEFEKSFLREKDALTPDLILCDSKLRDATGIEVLKRVRKTDALLPFILLVNQPDSNWTQEAFKAGVTDLLEKPFESLLFIQTFRGRIAQSRASRERAKMQKLLETQLLLMTTHVNRLIDQLNQLTRSKAAKLFYASTDEDTVRFQHANMREEKILGEIERCRIEYLSLAEALGKF
jgi:two-component system response regulator FixJ